MMRFSHDAAHFIAFKVGIFPLKINIVVKDVVNDVTYSEISRTPDSASWDEKTRARTHNSAKR